MTWWTVRNSVAWRGEIGDGERAMREPNGERERERDVLQMEREM